MLQAVAWRDEGGPFVRWRAAAETDGERLACDVPGAQLTAELQARLARMVDLVLGRAARVGRPARWELGDWREIAERAERARAEHPSRHWADIAADQHVDERTLREYRRLLRREREASGPHRGLQLCPGGI